MKLAWLTIPILALVTACGGSDKADTVANPPPATATAVPTAPRADATAAATPTESAIDPGVLSNAVLELSDMPGGFSVSAPGESSDDDDICSNVAAAAAKTPQNTATVTFGQSDFGPFIIQQVDLYKSRSDASAALESVRDSFKKCGPTWTDAQTPPTTWNIVALNFPKLGDDAFAVRVSSKDIPFFGTAQVDYVFSRRGAALNVVAYAAIGPVVGAASPLEDLAKKADAKLTKAGIR